MDDSSEPQHTEGQMDITEQEKTWQMFMGATKWFTLVVIALVVWLVGAFAMGFGLFGWTALVGIALAATAFLMR